MYAFHYTPNDDPKTGLCWIPNSMHSWIEMYVLAGAKVILGGRIRDKFKGIPSPEGNDLQIDGEQMLREGREDLQMLREDIDGMQRQLPPITD